MPTTRHAHRLRAEQAIEFAIKIAGDAGYFEPVDLCCIEQLCRNANAMFELEQAWEHLCRRRWVIPATKDHAIFGDGDEVIWKLRYKQASSWDGRLFAAGLSGDYQRKYCFADSHPEEPFPHLRFSSAVCGELHFIAIAGRWPDPSCHRVLAWGRYRLTPDDLDAGAPPTANAYGDHCRAPCGHDRGSHGVHPRLGEHSIDEPSTPYLLNPDMYHGSSFMSPEQAVTRSGRSAVVSADGNLFVFGASRYGLGFDEPEDRNWIEVPFPRLLHLPGLNRVASVSLGDDHALIVDTTGRVFSFGDGAKGKLGLGEPLAAVRKPSQIMALAAKHAVGVAAGGNHSLVLLDDGSVWAFGCNARDQLGQEEIEYTAIPVRVGGATGVTQVAAGMNLSAVITSEGSLLTFGQGNENGLGTGQPRTDLSTPTAVLPGRFVLSVSVGQGYMIARDDEGKAYSWGYNPMNQCGRGNDSDQRDNRCPDGFVETGQVQLPGPVRFVSACWASFFVLGLPHNTAIPPMASPWSDGAPTRVPSPQY